MGKKGSIITVEMSRVSKFAYFFILLFVFGMFVPALANQDRFPRPEFQSGYEIPPNDFATVRAAFYYYLDTAALFAALCLAAYLVLKKRSRKGVIALMLFSIAYFGFFKKGCVCSLGAIQNITAGMFSGYTISITVFLIFILPLVFSLFFGRVFCSGVCPLGAVQDFVALNVKRVPGRLCALLKIVPHIYLGAVVLFAATGAGFIICRFDPFVGIFRFGAPSGMVVLGALFLILGIFVARPYCRFLCPYGLLLGWMSSISKYKVNICPDKCVNCRLCENVCPVDAIQAPTMEAVKEPRKDSLRRLKMYCVSVPFLIIACAAAGWFSADMVSRLHPHVRLVNIIEREESGLSAGSLESEALRGDVGVIAELRVRSDATKKNFRYGMLIIGAYIGIVIGVYLIAQSVYKKRTGYEADPVSCMSCGRCYGYCPIGSKSNKEIKLCESTKEPSIK